ncbi:MAG TPA: lysylphosphatidylglycerol synthase transmembrane domain-containing protein [Acidobacteriaceae bacterium]|nr:lysylphosphatidylglycerol synthase transmembrane domain-containing protein [Acidobacteriaceae bacterium]
MKSRKALVILALALILTVIVFANRGRIHFDWQAFWLQLRHISWPHIAAGIALIYSTYWLRSARWAVFISATKKVSPFSLVGPQFIGFTAVALIGRLADITRPALVAKKVDLPVSSQLAVYAIERMFDLGAAAIIFSSALLFVPRDLPHHEVFVHTGLFSLAGTAIIAIFAVVLRVAGEAVARAAHGLLHPLSASIADSVAAKIRGFRDGLNAISSAQDFIITALISLAMWALIGLAYVQTLHAFTDTPQLATLSFSSTMLLMGASIGGSILQLPIVGWFTQIGITAAAMSAFYGAPIEAATACGALLLFVTFLSIIPAGLIAARLNHVSLRQVHAAEEKAEATQAAAE